MYFSFRNDDEQPMAISQIKKSIKSKIDEQSVDDSVEPMDVDTNDFVD